MEPNDNLNLGELEANLRRFELEELEKKFPKVPLTLNRPINTGSDRLTALEMEQIKYIRGFLNPIGRNITFDQAILMGRKRRKDLATKLIDYYYDYTLKPTVELVTKIRTILNKWKLTDGFPNYIKGGKRTKKSRKTNRGRRNRSRKH